MVQKGSYFTTILIGVIVFTIGAFKVYYGSLTPGNLFGFFTVTRYLLLTAASLAGIYPYLLQADKNIEFLNKIFTFPFDQKNEQDKNNETGAIKTIEFVDVSLELKGNKILQNISFKLESGKPTAILGGSGSEKSSILKLLQGFYNPTSGKILVNEKSMADLDLDKHRSQMGVVFQGMDLIEKLTINENIKLSKLDASDEEATDAAKKADIHEEIISMKDHYQTIIGGKGSNLSGGQEQKISLARLFLRNPSCCILDEPTSALDPFSQNLVDKTLEQLFVERIFVKSTHKLVGLKKFAQILIIDKGTLLEQGNPNDLLKVEGPFSKLYKEAAVN